MSAQSLSNGTMGPDTAKEVVFVLIPGAWHSTDYLEPMRQYLCELGYDSIAVSHQTLDPTDPGISVFDDAAKVEKTVKKLLDAGKNVVVVMHSYGGAVGSQAIGHLLSTTRPSPSDAAGKVLHLVYVAALIPQEGETMAALNELITAETPVEQRLPVEVIDGKLVCKEEIKDLFYHDLRETDRSKYYRLLQAFPAMGLPDAPTHFGWQLVPSTYICATNDRALSCNAQERMWQRADEALSGGTTLEGRKCTASSREALGQKPTRDMGMFTVKLIHSDHCSMFILRKHVESLGSTLMEICRA